MNRQIAHIARFRRGDASLQTADLGGRAADHNGRFLQGLAVCDAQLA
jgi:hypothetical protein